MNKIPVHLVKAAADPIATRISCGGNPVVGAYCVYRGKREDAIKYLEAVLEALKALKGEAPLENWTPPPGGSGREPGAS